MAISNQVQLRGGTSDEHKEFTGALREITVNTDNFSIHVHDGITANGHVICKKEWLDNTKAELEERIDDMQTNISNSHNHDDVYSKLTHNHDSIYLKKVDGASNVQSIVKEGYHGLCDENKNDTSWYRTTSSGLLPYKSGGYSSIGSNSWRFAEGWFNSLNAQHTYSDGVTICNGKTNQYSGIRFASQGSHRRIEYDAIGDRLYVAGTKTSSSGLSNMEATVFISKDYAVIGSTRLYIQSSDPGNVPVGSVWIKV